MVNNLIFFKKMMIHSRLKFDYKKIAKLFFESNQSIHYQ
jgi:hypothetical protein